MGSRTSDIGELPFSKHAFSRIQKVFDIHSSIVPVIDRRSSCFFIGLPCNWPSDDGQKSSIGKLHAIPESCHMRTLRDECRGGLTRM